MKHSPHMSWGWKIQASILRNFTFAIIQLESTGLDVAEIAFAAIVGCTYRPGLWVTSGFQGPCNGD